MTILRTRSERSAFTLVELVFVMVVLAILLVASLPRFTHTAARLRTEQAAFELTQLLRYAHERAVAGTQQIDWVWDEHERRAHLEFAPDIPAQGNAPQRVDEHLTTGSLVPEGVAVGLEREGNAVDRVRFFPDGTSETTAIQVGHDSERYVVNVDAVTSQAILTTGPVAR